MKKLIYIRAAIIIIPLIILALLSTCKSSNPTSAPAANEIWMQNNNYNPTSMTITAGTKITWINKDNATHTVTSGTQGNPDNMFDSGDLTQNQTFSYTFNIAGTFPFYCKHHSNMSGTITVK